MNVSKNYRFRKQARTIPMKPNPSSVWTLCPLLLALVSSFIAQTLSAADANPPAKMSYRGYLVDSNGFALGNASLQNYDVVFRLYSASQGGTLLWAEQQTVTVDKGNFSVFLGEGSAFGSEPNGPLPDAFVGADVSERFIGITVSGLGGEIAPRLQFLSSPFALLAKNATALVGPDGQPVLSGANGTIQTAGGNPRGIGAVDLQTVRVDPSQIASGTSSVVSGGENNVTSGVRSRVSGGINNEASGENSGVGGGGNNKAQALNAVVVGGAANEARGVGSAIVGGAQNIADSNDSFVGGGFNNQSTGLQSVISGGIGNISSANFATIAGGFNNRASFSGAFVGGGSENRAEANFNATVSGGFQNVSSGAESFIGGGSQNQAIGGRAAISGGLQNVVAVTGGQGVIGGGHANVVSAVNAAVGGGFSNDASGPGAAISGGADNTASGQESAVGGGHLNIAVGFRSTIAGGVDNQTTADHSAIGGGHLNRALAVNSNVAGGLNNQATGPGSSVAGGTNNLAAGEGAAVSGGFTNSAFGRDSWAGGHFAKAHHTGSFVWSDASSNLDFGSTGDNQFMIRATGGMGINGPPEKAMLQVHFSKSTFIGDYRWLANTDPGVGFITNGTANYSIWANDRVASPEFNTFSDARTKNIVGVSDRAKDLESIMAIEITDFSFKDTVSRGNLPQKKVIAQQVQGVLPSAVSQTKEVVPDLYQRTERIGPWIQLKNDLEKGDRVRIVSKGGARIYDVLEAESDQFRVALDERNEPVFVYGREVEDFLTVDYDAISMLNVSATQRLFELVQEQQGQIDLQKELIRELTAGKEQEIARLKSE